MKQGKRKCKNTNSDLDNTTSGDDFSSRNPLVALDERLDDIERHNRGRRKRKSITCQYAYPCNRSNSVPSKTVSFNPYVLHRVESIVPGRKNIPCWNKICPSCHGANRRPVVAASPCRKKSVSKKPQEHLRFKPLCSSSNSVYGYQESRTSVCNSPKPPSCHGDYPCCARKHKHPCGTDSEKSLPSEEDNRHHLPSWETFDRTYQSFNPANIRSSQSLASQYASRSRSSELCRPYSKYSLSSGSTGTNWRGYSAFDSLMAKYGDHVPSKMYPAMSSNVTYQSYAGDSSWPLGNTTHNKSPYTKFNQFTSPYSDATSPLRTPVSCSATTSGFTNMLKPFSENNDLNYKAMLTYPNTGAIYQSDAMRELSYEPLFRKDALRSCSHNYYPISKTTCPSRDLDAGCAFDRRRSLWHGSRPSTLLSKYSSTLLGGHANFQYSGRTHYDFTDDMKLLDRVHNISGNASPFNRTETNKGSHECYPKLALNCEMAGLPAFARYGDSNVLSSGKYNPYSSAENRKDPNKFNYGCNYNRSSLYDPIQVFNYYHNSDNNIRSTSSRSLSMPLLMDSSLVAASKNSHKAGNAFQKTLESGCHYNPFEDRKVTQLLEGGGSYCRKTSPRAEKVYNLNDNRANSFFNLNDNRADSFFKTSLSSEGTATPKSGPCSAKLCSKITDFSNSFGMSDEKL